MRRLIPLLLLTACHPAIEDTTEPQPPTQAVDTAAEDPTDGPTDGTAPQSGYHLGMVVTASSSGNPKAGTKLISKMQSALRGIADEAAGSK